MDPEASSAQQITTWIAAGIEEALHTVPQLFRSDCLCSEYLPSTTKVALLNTYILPLYTATLLQAPMATRVVMRTSIFLSSFAFEEKEESYSFLQLLMVDHVFLILT